MPCKLCVGITVFLVALCTQLFSADTSGAQFWSAADLKTLEKSLALKMDATKSGAQQLITKPTYNALVFHREGTGEAELHERFADLLVVRSGKGGIQVGGKIVDPRNIAKDEIRGKSIEGGTRYSLASGNVLYIPAKVPHRTLVDPGQHLNVLVVKIQP